MARKKEKQAQDGGTRIAYLVCALFAFIGAIFGSIAAYILLTTQGPQDIAGIFIGFVWVFLSVIVEMLVIARAGLFRQTDEPAEPLPEGAVERSVFYGKSYEASVSAEAEVSDPKMRFGLTVFMLVSALGLLVVENHALSRRALDNGRLRLLMPAGDVHVLLGGAQISRSARAKACATSRSMISG